MIFVTNGHVLLQMVFRNFFNIKLKNIREVFLLDGILIWKKILWRINFVLIKFLLNALLFEKSWNECKNLLFLHKAMCIELDHNSMKMQHGLSTFLALYSRRLWFLSWRTLAITWHSKGPLLVIITHLLNVFSKFLKLL